MTDRTIKVRLQAEVADFQRQMATASKSLDTLAKSSGDSAGAATTTMGKLVQSARLQGDAWRTAGSSLLGVGTAITGVNVAVAATGISYNTLQQKSRAALTTLMGGAREANAQMDKLDDFARTSPFSKAVFIQAQQQMIGFGIEAKKVVPYLSAINEAIAATGGNNNDLSEIVRIFSQVQAAAKITATDLMQFGQRGIDAAGLIGSQMGKTGAQIRDEITNGTIDASVALDALAAGMQERFAGASAGVKNTMEGAFDRVKAAWRDLAASFMEGAVGPEGGGWLVDFTNGAADLLRAIDKLPQPVKDFAGGISATAGAAAVAAGSVALAVPRYVELRTAWGSLADLSPRLTSGIQAVGRAAGVATGLIIGLQVIKTVEDQFRAAAPVAEDYAAAVTRAAKATGDFDSLASTIGGSLTGFAAPLEGATDAMRRYDAASADVIGRFLGLGAGGESKRIEEFFAGIDAALSAASPDEAAAGFRELQKAQEEAGWSTEKLVEMLPGYAGAMQLAAAEQGKGEQSASDLAEAMGSVPEPAEDAAQATERLAESATAFTDAAADEAAALRDATGALKDFYGLALSASEAQIALEAAFDAATEAAAENGATLDLNTAAGRANQSALNDIATAALTAAGAMAENGATADEVKGATQRARDEFIKAAQSMGATADEAATLADKYGLIPSKVATTITVKADLQGYYDADRVLNTINGRKVTAYVAIRQTGQAAIATGGYGADAAAAVGLADGGQARRSFSQGALLEGPGTTTSDSIAAWLSRREFVTRAAAVDYYGPDLMYAMNAMRIPREAFRQFGYADGGTPSRAYTPARLASGGMASLASPALTLSDNDVARIADAVRFGASAGTREGITERDSMQAHAIGRRR